MQIYQVDLDELAKAFPDPAAVPPLLKNFGSWLAGRPWRSVGAFDLAPQWIDMQVPGGEFHYHEFAMFIRLPTGSSVGYWLADGDVAHAPVVLLGSEGEFTTLAPDLETLLARIALGAFPEKGAAADFLYSEEDHAGDGAPDLRGEMQAFLRDAAGIQDLQSLIDRPVPLTPDLNVWVLKTSQDYQSWLATHPAIRAMAPVLDKYRPTDAQPWQGTYINITWVGEDYDVTVVRGERRPLEEAVQLKPHLARLRDDAARRKPGLGLWHSAALTVYKDQLYLSTNYLYEPEFRRARPSSAAYKADQTRMPRESRRIPSWLATILAS